MDDVDGEMSGGVCGDLGEQGTYGTCRIVGIGQAHKETNDYGRNDLGKQRKSERKSVEYVCMQGCAYAVRVSTNPAREAR